MHILSSRPEDTICRSCYKASFTKGKCPSCHLSVLEEFVESRDRYWHPACFRCEICEKDLSAAPLVDLSNNPRCQACFETDQGEVQEEEDNSRRRSVVRSRASMDLHKRSSIVGRPRGSTSVSFEELMNKIKLKESSKTPKLESHSKSGVSVSQSQSLSSSRTNSPSPTYVGFQTSDFTETSSTLEKFVHSNRENNETRASQHDKNMSVANSTDSDICGKSIRGQSLQGSIPYQNVRTPPSSSNRLCRRRSTPQTWRVPSTNYEADESEFPSDESPTRLAAVSLSTNTESRPAPQKLALPLGRQSTTLVKSSSSGHLPGIFAKRGGRALNMNLGGTKKCSGCLKSVFPMDQCAGPNGTWFHKACLRCVRCKKAMDSSSKLLEEHKDQRLDIFCRTCWDARN